MSLPNSDVVLALLNYYMTIRKKTWTLDANDVPVEGDGRKKYEICMELTHQIKKSQPSAAFWAEIILKAKTFEDSELKAFEARGQSWGGAYSWFQDRPLLALTMQAVRGYITYNLNDDAEFKKLKAENNQKIDTLNAEIISARKANKAEETIKKIADKKVALIKDNETLSDTKNYIDEFFKNEIRVHNLVPGEESFAAFERNVVIKMRPLAYLNHCYTQYGIDALKAQNATFPSEPVSKTSVVTAKPAAASDVKTTVVTKSLTKPDTLAANTPPEMSAADRKPLGANATVAEKAAATALKNLSVFKEPGTPVKRVVSRPKRHANVS